MSDIPTEIFRDIILPSVPVESLFRFRSVCKTWRRIIDDPSFIKHHITHGIGQDWFFHRHEKGKLFLLPINQLINTQTYIKRINATLVDNLVSPSVPDFPVPYCNGMVLLSSCDNDLVWRIWNPFTGESLEIKQCSAFAKLKCREGGIGYDEANDDYKVVRIIKGFTCVYSVNLEKWRRIEKFPDYLNVRIVRENGVFAYGALHWVSCSSDGVWVVALDLSTEKYHKIPLPSEVIRRRTLYSLNELSGCLFLSCNRWRVNFVMWMIKDYGGEETWIKMVSLEDDNPITTPLAYVKGKDKVLIHRRKSRRYRQDTYLWYDLGRKCSKRLGIEVSTDGTNEEWLAGFHYICGVFSSQVLPASLIRLKRSDCSDEEGVTSQETSKRQRTNAMASERLPLKIMFGEREDWYTE